MEKVVRKFNSFEEADAAEHETYMRMTPAERMKILFQLRELMYPDATAQRLARVYRIVKFERS